MFPFQSGELSFQVSNNLDNTNNISSRTTTTTNNPTTHQLVQEPYNEHLGLNTNLKSSTSRKRRSKISTHDNGNDINGSDTIAQKKVIHREVERQRRQEMSTLHSSLRSLLPMEYIRGKRSICDHVTEAANYIKDLEKNVKDLGIERGKLKESFSSLDNQLISNRDNNTFGCSSSSSATPCISCSSSSTSEYNVSIHKFSKTLQIEISTRSGDEDLYPLSKTLKVLAEIGLDVVSCVTSVVNQRWIYVIYCEVNDAASIDSSYLRDKLMGIVFSSD